MRGGRVDNGWLLGGGPGWSEMGKGILLLLRHFAAWYVEGGRAEPMTKADGKQAYIDPNVILLGPFSSFPTLPASSNVISPEIRESMERMPKPKREEISLEKDWIIGGMKRRHVSSMEGWRTGSTFCQKRWSVGIAPLLPQA